jgi:hypothetical protein
MQPVINLKLFPLKGEIKMSVIKDVYDMFEKLHGSIKDNKILELLLPIEEKLIAADKELISIQKKWHDEVFELQSANRALQSKTLELESIIRKLEDKKIAETGVVKDRPNR